MNELSQEALYNLIYSAIDFGDSLFELWLTITFAAILAVYFSSERISKYMRQLLVALYAASAVLLTGRWVVAMIHYAHYQDVIIASGLAPFPTPAFAQAFAVIHFLLYILGSLATVYFMMSFGKRLDSKNAA
jgi:hypothetical protein